MDYASEIGRLRALGYTLEAIREALAEVGIQVSKSTVQREASRQALPGQPLSRERPDSSSDLATGRAGPEPVASHPTASCPDGPRSGKEIAEAFVRQRITNPLLRKQESR